MICSVTPSKSEGPIVLLNNVASYLVRSSSATSRRKLIEDGTLVEDGGNLRFSRDSEFSSPSAAATVVHGGSANGLVAWKSKDGKTLKEIEAD